MSHRNLIKRKFKTFYYIEEKFKDDKGVIRSRISKKNRKHNGQMKREKGHTRINETLYRKLKTEQHKKPEVNIEIIEI
jgi:hypothetical protein